MQKIKISSTLQILLALVLGALFGIIANLFQWQSFVQNWIAPFGTLFINALKFIAVPLIVISLLNGFAALTDVSKLGKMARYTVVCYLSTTLIAVLLGLLLANGFQPGSFIDEATQQELLTQQASSGNGVSTEGPLTWLVELIPSFGSVNMISLIVMTLIFALAVTRLPLSSQEHLRPFFAAINDWVIQLIDFIMIYLGPIGVFALLAKITTETSASSLWWALLVYGITVLLGLMLLTFVIYPFLVQRLTNIKGKTFLKGILPAQTIALTTSSSAATLSMTLKSVEENLNVRKEVAGFVCPLGATANMDGTALYQGVICLFIAQVYGIDLTLGAQLLIVGTVVISSIGSAAVPSGGIAMLAIVLEQVGLPAAGLGLILALDRPLDMLRTVVNITSDAAVAVGVDWWTRG